MPAQYPLGLRTILRADKARSQAAAFGMAAPRRGPAYVEPTGTDNPYFFSVSWLFSAAEAQTFREWFETTLQRGTLDFTMPVRVEDGLRELTLRFMPDGILDTREEGQLWRYSATLTTRSLSGPLVDPEAVPAPPEEPALPNVIALLGDSLTSDGINNTADEKRNANRGMTHWVPFLTSQRFTSPQSMNFGVSGENSAQIAQRAWQVVSSGAGVCIVMAGTNDIGGFTAAQTKANLTSIYQQLSAAGILIIALPILPRTLTPEAQYSFPQQINEWMRDQAAVYDRFVFIQPYEFWDQYSPTYSPRADYTYDGLHPKAIGAFTLARPIAEYLNSIRPYPGIAVHSICDFFNSSNPRGVLNANPLLGGAGGTKGAGVTGDVADSHRLQAFANGGSIGSLTVTASKGASMRTGGVNQRIQVGGTATGGFDTSVILDLPSGIPNIAAGDTIEMLADIEIAGATIGISGIEAYIAVQQSGTFKWARDGYPIVSDDYVWRDVPEARFRTPPLTLSGTIGASFVGIKIYLKNTGTTRSCDVRINNIAVRKIVP